MLPNLAPGEEVVAVDTRAADIGDIVVFVHPDRRDFWLVKRMAPPPEPIGRNEAWVLSDNPDVTLSDSRTFGPVRRDSLWPVVERLDEDSFTQGCCLLAEEDEALRDILDEHGSPDFWERPAGFATLTLLILEQQVSLESGAAMYRRLLDETGGVTAPSIANLGESALRRLGVTRQKTRYLLGLAERVLADELALERLSQIPYEEARPELLSLHGVGPWTADAYLLSAVRHPNVFPVGDRALQVGTAEAMGIPVIPDEGELELISEPWRPIRAVAARIIWHGYLCRRGRVEPESPGLDDTPSSGA